MPDETQKERHAPHVLTTLAGVLIAFLLLAAIYVVYQAAHILFPQNVYETALPAVISDTVEADGVLLFDESYVAGSGNLGYLAADGERVSAGTAVAEVYSNASQASLRLQLNQLNDQIDLLQKSQNTSALQLDTLLKERSSALYDLLDTLDDSDYEAVDDDANAYLLAQNKLWVVTGEAANFTDQITALVQQSQSVQAQLGSPAQITAPQTGYFVRSSSSGRLNASADDILALNAQELQGYLQSDPVLALDGCAGKIVAGFTWRYVGVCTAKQGEKLLGQNGKPLSTAVEISFPGQGHRHRGGDRSGQRPCPLCACLQLHQRRCALPEPGCSTHLGRRAQRPAGACCGCALFKRGWHRGTNAGRKLHSRCVRETWQHCPLLPDRPGGRRPSPHHRRRLHPCSARRDRGLGQQGEAL